VAGARPVERWRIVSPAGKESVFETFDELREAIVAGKIGDEPRSDRIEVHPSEIEVLPSSRKDRDGKGVNVHEQPTLELPAISVHVRDDGTEEIEEAPRAPASDPDVLKRPITLKRPFAPEAAALPAAPPPRPVAIPSLPEEPRPHRASRVASALGIVLLGAVGFVVFQGSRGADDAGGSGGSHVDPSSSLAARAADPDGEAPPVAAPPPLHAALSPSSEVELLAGDSAPPTHHDGEAASSEGTSARQSRQTKQDTALSAFRAGDYTRARLIYDELLAANPEDEATLASLGDTLRAQGDRGAAERFYKRAIASNPRYVPARLGLADVTWDGGDYKSAQSMYADLVAHFPTDVVPERARQRAAADGITSPFTP